MNLLRCHIQGFGKLADATLNFESGLNIVFAGNEAGKTTLQRFLVALLYGQLRADLKTHRRLDGWVAQYKPWYASEYGGMLWCRLVNGRELELRRSFGKEEACFQIRTFAGEEITHQYEMQRNGDVLFARTHLGLPKELFESVAVIRESKLAELNGRDSIRDRIANLAQSGDEELSVRQSLSRLEEALESIGSERAPTRPYKQTLDLAESLQSERKTLEKRREEFQSWVDERARLASEVARRETAVAGARRAVVSARSRETAAKVRALEEIDSEIALLRGESEAVHGDPSFPAHRLESLSQLVGVRESIDKQLADVRAELSAATDAVARAEKDRRELSQYGELDASVEAEKRITDWFVSYLSLSLQKDDAQRTAAALNDEIISLTRKLEGNPALGISAVDWERKARGAAEEERVAARKSAALAASISEEQSSLAAIRRKVSTARIFAAAALLLVCALLGTRIALESAPLKWSAVLAGAAACGAVAAISLAAASRSQRAVRKSEDGIRQLKAEHAKVLEDGRKTQSAMRQAMADSGFTDIEGFLAEAKKCDLVRQRVADLSDRARQAKEQRDRIDTECLRIYTRLKESLARVGLGCSPGNLKAQIDVMRANLRRYRELDARYRGLTESMQALRTKEGELANEAERRNSQIADILAEGGVDSPETFRDACRRRQRMLELLDKKASRSREYQRLCGAMTLDDWKAQLRQLVELEQHQEKPELDPQPLSRDTSSAKAMPLLPYCPSSEEAEQEEKCIASLLWTAREEYARLGERVSQAFHNYREMSEIDEDLALAEEAVQELARNRDALTLALDTLRILSREQQEVLAPQLNRAVEQRFLRICQGRYEEVKIDPDLRVLVRETGTAELRQSEQLSRGAQDQLYFALRFGILDLVSNGEESCPCFLDEPFAAYDRVRMIEALKILDDEARRRQLLLFTCREDLLDLARAHAACIIPLAE